MSIFLALLLFLLALVMGMAFSTIETRVLGLHRARLLRLFSEGADTEVTEQRIFDETKDIYMLNRLAIYASIVLATFGAHWTAGILMEARSGAPRPLLAMLVTLLAVPPTYVFTVFGIPRLLSKSPSLESEADLAGWVRLLIAWLGPVARMLRFGALVHNRRFLPHHELTKADLVAMVTDLEEDNSNGVPEQGSAPGHEEETDEEEIIYNILDLENTLVREVMKPINSVHALRLKEATVETARELSRQTGHSRFPVYPDRIVNLVGYVSVYDMLNTDDEKRQLSTFVREGYYVPEFMPVSQLLREFMNRNLDAVIVVDEYGGCSGWVTREDVLEEIVGEIEDEFDARRRRIHPVSETEWLVDGTIDIDDLAEELPLTFEEPQYDTLAGFLFLSLGCIPQIGDEVQTEQAHFRVEQMEGHRITQVRVDITELEPDEATE